MVISSVCPFCRIQHPLSLFYLFLNFWQNFQSIPPERPRVFARISVIFCEAHQGHTRSYRNLTDVLDFQFHRICDSAGGISRKVLSVERCAPTRMRHDPQVRRNALPKKDFHDAICCVAIPEFGALAFLTTSVQYIPCLSLYLLGILTDDVIRTSCNCYRTLRVFSQC